MGDDITIGVTEIVNNIEVTAQPNDQIVDISVVDNADDVTLNITPTVIEININKGSSYAKWGDILGTLSDQTDLQSALNLKANLVGGKVPASELPSYVDDVVEVANYAALPTTGETGKIYVTLDNNKIYRWSGSVYIEIAANSAIWGAITGTLSSQTDLVNALNLRVPYTGATGNVNLGEYGLTSGFLGLDTTPTSTPTGVGTIYWDSANRTAALIDGDGDTTLQIGQEQRILVHNNTGSTLTDGQVVYVTGSTGNLPSVSLADATSETTSAATVGVVTESIANGADGFITTSGIVNGLNTLAFNEGDLLWLSTTAGDFTTTKPSSPAHLVLIGYVIKKAGGNGSILVKIQNTQELEESSDVLFTSLTDKDVLTYESSSQLWKNKSLGTIFGGTSSQFVKGDGSLDSNTYALTSQLHNAVTIGTANGLSLSTQVLSLGLASGSANGALSSTDWTTFNNKVESVAASLPLGSTGGKSPVISITQATTSSNGYLSSTDWNTFNGKQSALSGTGFVKISGTTISYDNSTYVPTSRTLTINGTAYDLSADRSWTISAGISGSGTTGKIPLYTGSTALGDSSFTEFSTYVNLTKPLTIAYSTATSGQGLNLSLNNSGSTGTTLYLYNAGTGNLAQFQKSDNTTAFLINASGNVGIGTTSPAEKLSVSGAIISTGGITGHGANRTSLSQEGGNGAFWQSYGANASTVGTFSLRQATSDFSTNRVALHINSSGNVGIGTTSPSGLLHLQGNTTNPVTQVIDNLNAGTSAGTRISFRYQGTETGYIYNRFNGADFNTDIGSSDYLRILTASTERMRITSGGQVQISSPISDALKLTNTNSGAYNGVLIQNDALNQVVLGIGGSTVGGSNQNRGYSGTVSNIDYYLMTNNTERMRITSGGDVGIGTTAPLSKLTVSGNLSLFTTNQIRIYNSAKNNWAEMSSPLVTGDSEIDFKLVTKSGIFYVSPIGTVYINTLGTGLVYSNGGNLTSTNPSDSRLKNDITDLQYGLNEILQLRPVSYNWKDDKINQGKQFGFIAQEVQEVMPELVKEFETEEGNRLGLDKEGIYAALVNAIQEQQKQIEELKTLINK